MRISTRQVFLNNLSNINTTNEQIFHAQEQLTTGKKILQPSDDPLASSQIMKFKQELALSEQYASNIEVAKRRLTLEEKRIDQINTQAIRLKELVIKGKTGTISASERKIIASEIGEIIGSIEGMMNTKDIQGEYLFSGYKGFVKPYTLDQRTGRYVFNGDEGQRNLQVGPENKVASTDSGFDIFEKVAKVPGYVIADVNQDNNQITKTKIVEANKFDNLVSARGKLTISHNGAVPPVFSVTDESGKDVAYTVDGSTLKVGGVELEFDIGRWASGNNGAIKLDAISQHNILNTALDAKKALETADFSNPESKAEFNKTMDNVLENLKGVEDLNLVTRSSIGGRANSLDKQDSVNEDYKLFTKQALSSFEDLSYDEAISLFMLYKTALQSSYASFSQVKDLNLFTYLR